MDALGFDPPAKFQLPHGPHATAPPIPSGTSEDVEDSHRAHMFKIVTTKRTLLLCAPSEEEEIKWLGAIQALIARRQSAGGVPGQSQSAGGAISTTKTIGSDVSQTPGTGLIPSGGMKSKVKRLSGGGLSPSVTHAP